MIRFKNCRDCGRLTTKKHVCYLGIRYMIERKDTKQWLTYMGGWTNNPLNARIWEKQIRATYYLKTSTTIPSGLDCEVTEHEFF